MKNVIIHREIGIDTGHRVPDHGSKCRNPHGHRYRVIATCEGPVVNEAGNEEDGMVVDFGNIKKYMMDTIDAVFDHGFVVSKADRAMMEMFFPGRDPEEVHREFQTDWMEKMDLYVQKVSGKNNPAPISLLRTESSDQDPDGMKVIVVPYTPTAENLAFHMFNILKRPIEAHFQSGLIRLVNIRLYETPNGWVDYPGMEFNSSNA